MIRTFAAVAVTMMVLTASAGAHDGAIARPLHLPRVSAGDPCPVSAGPLASKLGRGLPRMAVTAGGPVHVMSVGGELAGTVSIEDSRADPQGWRGQKAPWIASPGYRGPILIRGSRIDAAGEVRFARDAGEHRRQLYERRGEAVQPNGWRVWPSLLLVRAPGCYGLQIDGTSFSRVIVIRVLA